jgi:RpiR family carbohydrate utilization transcriptional regulator
VDILDQIRHKLPKLRKSEKKVADFVLEKADEAVRLSITELAQQCRTSEPTVIRFCRQLGLKGYLDLRLNLAAAHPSRHPILEDVRATDNPVDIFAATMNAVIRAVNVTLREINLKIFSAAVDAMASASRWEFYGLGGSGAVAMDAHHKFFRLGTPCIAYSDPHMQIMSAAQLGDKDLIVCISHSGSTKDLIQSAEMARESGATVVGIIGKARSPLAAVCHYPLSVGSEEVAIRLAPMSSRLMQLAVLDALFVSVAMRMADSSAARLDKVKRALREKHV